MHRGCRWNLVALAAVVLLACGDRVVGQHADGGAPADGATQGHDFVSPPPGPCAVGIRVDDCCTGAEPVTQAQIDADPCLVPYPPRNIPQACFDKQPAHCALVDCAYRPPSSRVAQRLANGQCAFANECETDADCIWAVDRRLCCDCGQALPRVLFDRDTCYGPRPTGSEPGPCVGECMDKVLCGPCMAPPGAPLCQRPDPGGPKVCISEY